METALLLGSLLLQVRSIICDPTWSKSDPSWRPVSIFESVISQNSDTAKSLLESEKKAGQLVEASFILLEWNIDVMLGLK